MGSSIKILDSQVVDQIAAGEVVEKPSSVVKELIENSIDAGAKQIQVLIENGGFDLISISDDGVGMSREDLEIAVERFATSKLRKSEDLESIITYGFRGEALPSIASVSKFSITSKKKDSDQGFYLEISESGKKTTYPAPSDFGTKINVRELFYNVPARRKFLKSEKTESNSIKSVIADFAVARPDITFIFQESDKVILSFNALDTLADRVKKLNLVQGKQVDLEYDRQFVGSSGEDCFLKISGKISEPIFCPKIGSKMRFLVNGRIIKSQFLMRAVREGYQSLIKPGYFPSGLLSVEISPSEVDVNVHPQKSEVRFSNEGLLFASVRNAVQAALSKVSSESVILPKETKVYDLKSYHKAETSDQVEIKFVGNSGFTSDYISSYQSKEELSATPNFKLLTPVISDESQKLNTHKLKFIGQVFKLFLVFSSNERMAIVDMHAAHERVTFYKLKKEFLDKQIRIQEMLLPITVPIDVLASLEGLEEKLEAIKVLGIDAEQRNHEIVVRGLSPLLSESSLKELLVEVIDKSPAEGVQSEINAKLDSYLARLACHGSLRRGRELKPEEAYLLMDQLEMAEISGWCPHGRPVIWWLSEEDLERQFGRIQ